MHLNYQYSAINLIPLFVTKQYAYNIVPSSRTDVLLLLQTWHSDPHFTPPLVPHLVRGRWEPSGTAGGKVSWNGHSGNVRDHIPVVAPIIGSISWRNIFITVLRAGARQCVQETGMYN